MRFDNLTTECGAKLALHFSDGSGDAIALTYTDEAMQDLLRSFSHERGFDGFGPYHVVFYGGTVVMFDEAGYAEYTRPTLRAILVSPAGKIVRALAVEMRCCTLCPSSTCCRRRGYFDGGTFRAAVYISEQMSFHSEFLYAVVLW